eukprot:6608896-Lingulodinium_polyedra.AAC.1
MQAGPTTGWPPSRPWRGQFAGVLSRQYAAASFCGAASSSTRSRCRAPAASAARRRASPCASWPTLPTSSSK